MTLPAFLLGVIISTLYGAIFHLWRGGNLGRLLLYIVLSWAGFWVGQFIAEKIHWYFLSFGPLHFGFATFISWIFLLIGHWLSKVPGKN